VLPPPMPPHSRLLALAIPIESVGCAFDERHWRGEAGNRRQRHSPDGHRHRELAASGELLVATHLPFPSAGHVAIDGEAFRWVPISWDY
jgi:hypothetical protein